eukprot:GILK01003163.1.p1 GENE.GILK01003163.1~~GILK01003163.1.p1  ORF type:complete len:1097 (+),score=141.59 GILK01003163.1:95-3385(+)
MSVDPQRLLSFDPFDQAKVHMLDQVVYQLYSGAAAERDFANSLLNQIKELPNIWLAVDTIIELSQSVNTKYYALQILEGVIATRWKILPPDQREGIKNFVVNLVIKLGSEERLSADQSAFLTKLNLILVQIVKHEWPHNWPSFIPDLCGASRTSQPLCENNMAILKLLSEEVFDYSRGTMTQAKIKEMKHNLNNEFRTIYELCDFLFKTHIKQPGSVKASLVRVTLETLNRFLSWIPLGFIFETDLIPTLVMHFLEPMPFRISAIQCLTEIASLNIGNMYEIQFVQLLQAVMTKLTTGILPANIDIVQAYNNCDASQQSYWGDFCQNLALLLTGFFKAHLRLLEVPEHEELLGQSMMYLVKLTEVPEIDELFKICLEYWHQLASMLYHSEGHALLGQQAASGLALGSQGLVLGSPNLVMSGGRNLKRVYQSVLTLVRRVLISRMAKPEEVLIVEDDNGSIIREAHPDTEAINLYKSMREALIYLTHLNPEDIEGIMLEKLNAQVEGTEWSWNNLNRLCWAIGSISGAMSEDDEKRFLVTVIKDLLRLCELKRGKDNKAVVASNIMYVVGQYPRFLRAHWKFLKTVVNKLFEFMHEVHPGVQDMACETFLKIAQKLRKKFVVLQAGESMTFIEELLLNIREIICDLEVHQIHQFYEAVGHMVSAASDGAVRDTLLLKLMELPNETWAKVIQAAQLNVESLKAQETIGHIHNILRTNERVATAVGQSFVSQLGRIYLDMLNVYKCYSEFISNSIVTQGPAVTRSVVIRGMRSVKKETLKLIETFVEKCSDVQTVAQNFIPPLLDPVLGDYSRNIPAARDPEVLSLFAMVISQLKQAIFADVPRIFETVFECTLDMITKDFQTFPDHRVNFFLLVKAINQHCFQAFFHIPPNHLKLVVDSIVWAFKHETPSVAETGLQILTDFLTNVSRMEDVAQAFYQQYFMSLLQDIFFVLTDTLHKAGFKLHTIILMQMFQLVESGAVRVPLGPVPAGAPFDNKQIMLEFLTSMLLSSFPNLNSAQVQAFVLNLFNACRDRELFKTRLRDFLVTLKEFSESNDALFEEEKQAAMKEASEKELHRQAQVPGLIPQYDPRRPDESMID